MNQIVSAMLRTGVMATMRRDDTSRVNAMLIRSSSAKRGVKSRNTLHLVWCQNTIGANGHDLQPLHVRRGGSWAALTATSGTVW